MHKPVSLWVTVILLLLFQVVPSRAANEYDVKSFGAVGDGRASDTKAIQKGIDSLTKVGGGILQFKSGTFLAGQIYLKSKGTLDGSGKSFADFDSIEVDHCHFDGLKDAAFKIQGCEGGKMSNMNFHDLELINSPRIHVAAQNHKTCALRINRSKTC